MVGLCLIQRVVEGERTIVIMHKNLIIREIISSLKENK